MGVGEAAAPADRVRHRRVVDEQHPAQSLAGQPVEQAVQPGQLARAKGARGQMRRGRHGRAAADQGHRRTQAQGGKQGRQVERQGLVRCLRFVAAQRGQPGCEALPPVAGHVAVVVAGHHRDPVGRAQGAQPGAGRRAFARQAQVGEVAGDGNVVRPHPLQVVRKRGKKPLVLLAAPFQLPAQPAEQPFAEEIARSQQLRAGQVRIGAVGEHPPRGLAWLVRIGRERPTGKGRDWSG